MLTSIGSVWKLSTPPKCSYHREQYDIDGSGEAPLLQDARSVPAQWSAIDSLLDQGVVSEPRPAGTSRNRPEREPVAA